MRWTNDLGQYVSLAIVDYEFPESPDDNWLVTEGDIYDGKRGWQFRGGVIETDGLASLAAWLSDVADGQRLDKGGTFSLEPNIDYRVAGVDGARVVMSIALEAECRPPWDRNGSEPVIFEFRLTSAELRTTAASLLEELVRFPFREAPRPPEPDIAGLQWVPPRPGRDGRISPLAPGNYFALFNVPVPRDLVRSEPGWNFRFFGQSRTVPGWGVYSLAPTVETTLPDGRMLRVHPLGRSRSAGYWLELDGNGVRTDNPELLEPSLQPAVRAAVAILDRIERELEFGIAPWA